MATDIMILNTAVLDLRSPDFGFADKLAGAGGLAKCATPDMPAYSQAELKQYVDTGCAAAGGPGNTAPLQARAGLKVAVGANLGRGEFEGMDIQGATFKRTLHENGVDVSAMYIHPDLPTGTTFIHEVPSGERGGITYFPNANNDFDFEVFKSHVKRLAPKLVYYMYSGLSERGDAEGGKSLADFIAWCRAQGCLTIVDSHTLTGNPQELIAQGAPVEAYNLLKLLLPELDIFFTSADEARMIRNTLEPGNCAGKLDTPAAAEAFLEFVKERFLAGEKRARLFGVTVKNGAYICYVLPDGSVGTSGFCASRFMFGDVIDLVGAGDSFRAGLTAYIATHEEEFRNGTMRVEDAVQSGNLMATLYVTAPMEDRYGLIPPFERILQVVEEQQEFSSYSELLQFLQRK